jgi:hypothetical protein
VIAVGKDQPGCGIAQGAALKALDDRAQVLEAGGGPCGPRAAMTAVG